MNFPMNSREVVMPEDGHRILIYSPMYEEHNSMRWRVIDSGFFDLMRDATHWVYLDKIEV